MAISGIVSVGAISLNNVNSQENETSQTEEPSIAPPAQDNTSVTTETEVAGSFAKVKTTQNQDYISILITKNPDESTPPQPEVPVIIVPGEGENGTIVVPDQNETGGNVTIIDPIGNVTQIPDGNVTVIDNDTVVVAPPDENITETPGNVTVIDPEPPLPPTEEECGCPPANETGEPIPPVVVEPAPGQEVNVTQPVDNQTEGPSIPPGENETAPVVCVTEPCPGGPVEPEPVPEQPGGNVTTEEPAPGTPDNETGTELPPGNQTIVEGDVNINATDGEVTPSAFGPNSPFNLGSSSMT